ncbi:uncharacterized protein B0I36DRAFT_53917 [Microdochium trichocladiopsis]|uniref:DUF7587 domain-containing protein n=1 Tax=Microdochium trichocladiopsis TaxID=1682393 RepID=A0A9P9BHL6_9PEZI|nr:uncharacterized protein B0I36DRAFT_53917 [Microdochium trichocladiopsis]KAH7012031.1 hypothetical protein B0I36DRAFT_53917 [Microdochium trichocladiopsis]
MDQLRAIFQPHQFTADEQYIDLYHVYDNLSRTPYQDGLGIVCGDRDVYTMNAWHVITPSAMRKHLEWSNRTLTQFISFYKNQRDAEDEQQRRRNQTRVAGGHYRKPESVRIAHVRLERNTHVWAFSRKEMLSMMGSLDPASQRELSPMSGLNEWFVWGLVPDKCVENRRSL